MQWLKSVNLPGPLKFIAWYKPLYLLESQFMINFIQLATGQCCSQT